MLKKKKKKRLTHIHSNQYELFVFKIEKKKIAGFENGE